MENRLVTRWRGMRNPAGSQQTHLDGQKVFLSGNKVNVFSGGGEKKKKKWVKNAIDLSFA